METSGVTQAVLFAIMFTAIPIIWLGLSLKKDLSQAGEKAKLAFGVMVQIILGIPLLIGLFAGVTQDDNLGIILGFIGLLVLYVCDTVYLYTKQDDNSQAYPKFHIFMMVLYVILFGGIGVASVVQAINGGTVAVSEAAAVVMNPLGQGPIQQGVIVNNPAPNNNGKATVAIIPGQTRGNALLEEAAATPANVVVNVNNR
jgi:hypothetical protein